MADNSITNCGGLAGVEPLQASARTGSSSPGPSLASICNLATHHLAPESSTQPRRMGVCGRRRQDRPHFIRAVVTPHFQERELGPRESRVSTAVRALLSSKPSLAADSTTLYSEPTIRSARVTGARHNGTRPRRRRGRRNPSLNEPRQPTSRVEFEPLGVPAGGRVVGLASGSDLLRQQDRTSRRSAGETGVSPRVVRRRDVHVSGARAIAHDLAAGRRSAECEFDSGSGPLSADTASNRNRTELRSECTREDV